MTYQNWNLCSVFGGGRTAVWLIVGYTGSPKQSEKGRKRLEEALDASNALAMAQDNEVLTL